MTPSDRHLRGELPDDERVFERFRSTFLERISSGSTARWRWRVSEDIYSTPTIAAGRELLGDTRFAELVVLDASLPPNSILVEEREAR